MKTEKFTLEFQAYEIENIKKALEFVSNGIKDNYLSSNAIYRYTQGGETSKKQLSQIAFTLKSIERQMQPKEPQCRIYGSEISFELFVFEKDLKEKVRDVWIKPSRYALNYWEVSDSDESAYYSFLKFLWIDFPNRETVRIADYASENNLM